MLVPVSSALVAACLLPAAGKLLGHPRMRMSAAHFGIAWPRYRLIGLAELAAAAGLLGGLYWRPLGIAAGAGVALLLLGALHHHRRAHDGPREILPALVVLGIDAVYLAVAVTA